MKNRILLKEIPSGKFHSSIFTTFSINLYYLEQQVLPLLGSKGIHYVSVLADGNMLSNQLENHSCLSQQRKRNYAINGIQSKGAFHPKLIFLAGEDSILLLLGSGNLTSSGHGKNLEVWNSIYINNQDDTKYGFVIQSWNYLKLLHSDLGESMNNKLKNIEENCSLLSNDAFFKESTTFDLNEHSQISFHYNQKNNPLFNQISEIIGEDVIDIVTIMCPFHDIKGRFIQELDKRFNPNQINVIIQSNFGSLPSKMTTQSKVRFFEWSEIMEEKQKQTYFHAKNIIFKGQTKNYLISGSANASTAAFGTLNKDHKNQEACIIYQSTMVDYLNLLSINIKGKIVDLKDYETKKDMSELNPSNPLTVFIRTAEKNYDEMTLIFNVKDIKEKGIIHFYDTNGLVQFEEKVFLETGEHTHQTSIPNGINLMFVKVSVDDNFISNSQFITNINAFEKNNPSPKNKLLNDFRKKIAGGYFLSKDLNLMDYLNTIHQQKGTKKGILRSNLLESKDDKLPNEKEDDLLHLSYAEIQEISSKIKNNKNSQYHTEYKSIHLCDAVMDYLKEDRETTLQAKIDEEDTEDINISTGSLEKEKRKTHGKTSKSKFKKSRNKVLKFLENYQEILRQKTIDAKSEKPSLIDLSMYLIMLEILLHLIGYKETIDEENMKKHLLLIPVTSKNKTWSNYLIQYIGLFTLWCTQKKGFKNIENSDYILKLESYRSMAFQTSLSALSIFNIVNKEHGNNNLQKWINLNLLNSDMVFNISKKNKTDVEEYMNFIPQNILDDLGEVVIEDEIEKLITQLSSFKIKTGNFSVGDFCPIKELGYAYVDKIIQNPKNTFYKLFNPGFEWDEKVNNYWNGKVYSINEKKWYRSRK